MKRDIIKITGKEISITGQNIWMSAAEIAGLFNVTAASVQNAIRGILKADTLNDYEVCRCVHINERSSLDVYSLELIIPLAYRFNTYYTNLFRKWIVRKATTETRQQPIILHLGNDMYC
ncbi:hypothetical protein [Bacteroides thetaiotaomicron]|uniref:hypothetical protein n=1 Tax=Bacteroides thetaiotaomicron TaxID=818 RepID=UPI001F2F3083|nr:hypothetical protein [Bacteroides thetaiotaomicron]MCE8949692.1 hypothetical protein [Bacteroides thetaiotaomicron]MCE8967175.1 hypothetical protein [Bacteroides thetaiotaomicron]